MCSKTKNDETEDTHRNKLNDVFKLFYQNVRKKLSRGRRKGKEKEEEEKEEKECKPTCLLTMV